MAQSAANQWPLGSLLTIVTLAFAALQDVKARPASPERRPVQVRDIQDATVNAVLRAEKRTKLPVPLEVVGSLDAFSAEIARRIHAASACAFVLRPKRDRIYILASCSDFIAAREGSRLGALRLAAVIEHEIAHVEGADEIGALDAQLNAVERFQRSSMTTAAMLTPLLSYRTSIERRIAELRSSRSLTRPTSHP